jgi:hypothetical protein
MDAYSIKILDVAVAISCWVVCIVLVHIFKVEERVRKFSRQKWGVLIAEILRLSQSLFLGFDQPVK